MSNWCVDDVTHFDNAFSVHRNEQLQNFPIPNLSQWNTAAAVSMASMFYGARQFTGAGLETWDVSRVTSFTNTFRSTFQFNADLSAWRTVSAVSVRAMFRDTRAFAPVSLNSWDVSSVKDMRAMFGWSRVFNGNIAAWNVQTVQRVDSMFRHALAFNQDVSAWNLGNVWTADGFAWGATQFAQNLCAWGDRLPSAAIVTDMFSDTACPVLTDSGLPNAFNATISQPISQGPYCFTCI